MMPLTVMYRGVLSSFTAVSRQGICTSSTS